MHAFIGEMRHGDVGVFGGHFQAAAWAGGGCVIKAFFHRHHHAAFGNAQIQGLIQAIATVFGQHIAACDAQVGCAVLHISGHIGGTHNHQADVGMVGVYDEFA